jgi:uncharacterized protein DUF4157
MRTFADKKHQPQRSSTESATPNTSSAVENTPADRVLEMQHTIGNQAVLQSLRAGNENTTPPTLNEVLTAPGAPLDSATRDFMEPRFGQDFSDVRVHADTKAAESAEDLQANAYTVGRHVVIGGEQPPPETTAGRKLLAHELAHVVQQNRGGAEPPLVSDSPLEQAADQAAAGVMQGEGAVHVAGASAPGIARDEAAPKPKPPVPQVRQTPFHFISESPALDNWKVSVKEMLESEYSRNFASFEEAHQYFQEYLKQLPSDEARENYADRMRDRARKRFFRQERKSPSYTYNDDQKDRLRRGAAPIEGQQLEHMEEVKTKVREGIKVPGHPERALDPANIYLTEGGKGGTAPKGSLHAEKWRTVKSATERSREIREAPPAQSTTSQLPKGSVFETQPPAPQLPKGSVFEVKPTATTPKVETAPSATPRPATTTGQATTAGGPKVSTQKAKNTDFQTRGRVIHDEGVPTYSGPEMHGTTATKMSYIGEGLAQILPEAISALQDKLIRHRVAKSMLAKWSMIEKWRREYPEDFILAVVSLQEWEHPDPAGQVARMVNYVEFFHGATKEEAEANASGVYRAGVPKGWREVGPFLGWIEPTESLSEAKDKLDSEGGVCFIATACYNSPVAPEVCLLREFRDVVLNRSRSGRAFTRLYYRLSPPIADCLRRHDVPRNLVRKLLLTPLIETLRRSADRWRSQAD